ncbi:MAG: hemolysin [Deltaproteobacteria bacterium GWA2_57_13]|nr:MAG: hemolysin [Deltaproteobacteria bacterium GWA2_57_13]OGQ49287.1 MAG: hemolysin [Deltaproteobacteria bacterium RIFCSPLOWO2_02_FULL_57_26]OGQ76237.1 MAG: hemolysin [Deltaproteobacteria bacterium RIFCSPLOWO2_12_FULL_57_22]
MGKRERLDKLLVERGLAATREQGCRRILAGEVLVNDRPVAKVGSLIDREAQIRLKTKPVPYVSRGGAKLEGALKEFQVDVRDRIALDVGASTGGFTECLLAHGARRVYAVDVGYGQLAWKLRGDRRVVVLERRNIRYLEPGELAETPELATIDVSFISLRLVLPRVKLLLAPKGEIVALIKPQFEVGKGKVGKGGVVRRAEEHLRVIGEIQEAARGLGFKVAGVIESPLLGPKGNKEFFIHLVKGEESG